MNELGMLLCVAAAVIVTALLDRLIHRIHVISCGPTAGARNSMRRPTPRSLCSANKSQLSGVAADFAVSISGQI